MKDRVLGRESDVAHGSRRYVKKALLIGGVLAAMVAVSALIVRRFDVSERIVTAALVEMGERLLALDAEGCVDATLDWSLGCEAMRTICEASVQRVMHACLDARDRGTYCESVKEVRQDTHFGVEQCRARGVDRRGKKACALAYGTIDGFCKQHEQP